MTLDDAQNISVDTALGEFVERVRRKFGSESNLPIKCVSPFRFSYLTTSPTGY